MWDSLSTILSSNKVHHRASLEAYGVLEQPFPWSKSNSLYGALEQSKPSSLTVDMTELKTWLWYYIRNHNSSQWYDIVHLEHNLSWFFFLFLFCYSKDLISMEMYSLLITGLSPSTTYISYLVLQLLDGWHSNRRVQQLWINWRSISKEATNEKILQLVECRWLGHERWVCENRLDPSPIWSLL